MSDIGNSVCKKLALTEDELNSMYTPCPVGGCSGEAVAARIRQQYGIRNDEPLGAALAERGILTEPEGYWLDDDGQPAMTYHEAFGDDVVFVCQYPVRFLSRDYAPGDELTVGLVRSWDEEEGLGEGGPWGHGGYPSRLVAELAGTVKSGHTHTCEQCDREIEYSTDFDCDTDDDHALGFCAECTEMRKPIEEIREGLRSMLKNNQRQK